MHADFRPSIDREKDQRIYREQQANEHIKAFWRNISHDEEQNRRNVTGDAEHVDVRSIGSIENIESFDASLTGKYGQVHQRSEGQTCQTDTECRSDAEQVATHQPSACHEQRRGEV